MVGNTKCKLKMCLFIRTPQELFEYRISSDWDDIYSALVSDGSQFIIYSCCTYTNVTNKDGTDPISVTGSDPDVNHSLDIRQMSQIHVPN